MPRPRSRSSGFTLVEIAVSATVLTVGVLGLFASVVAGDRLTAANHEAQVAFENARATIAQMQSVPLDQVFRTYNANTQDDVLGAGTAPGAKFSVPGLACRKTDKDGKNGDIDFPTATVGGAVVLSESATQKELGMPRDLDGDGVVSSGALTTTPLVLPVRLRVAWRGARGNQSIDVRSMLVTRGGS